MVDAWLITAGTNAGVVKEVGEALNKYRYKNQTDGVNIPCIGIGSWGYTAGKEQLDRSIAGLSSIDLGNKKTSALNITLDALNMVKEKHFPLEEKFYLIGINRVEMVFSDFENILFKRKKINDVI